MSRAGAKAKRTARPRQATVRSECPTCYLGVVHHVHSAGPGEQSYRDLHAVACGCAGNNEYDGTALCLFGDGWLDAA